MKRIRYSLSVIIIGILFLVLCCPVFAASTDTGETLRVGYMDYRGFIDKEADGSYSGYAVEYLNEISKYTAFQYEFIFGTWTELLNMLEK